MKNTIKPTFKNFLIRITEAENKEDAIKNIFYGTTRDENGNIKFYGIDYAYQMEKISYSEYELLLAIIEKMA